VFDSRSGMFYESRSDFFYDPKSKLYYGNKKGAYFCYDDTTNPPFIEVHRMVPAAAAGTTESTPGDASTSTAGATKPDGDAIGKAVIAIKLKTKKIKKQKGGSIAKVVPIVSKVQKEQVANIEKWSEKKAEIQADRPVLPSITVNPPPSIIVPSPSSATTDHAKVATTAKGEPICTICKRKFSTIDKLRLHEKASELHKQNLAKLNTSKEKRELVPSVEYQDRAKKRRAMHGPDPIMPPPRMPVVPLNAVASSAEAAPTVADNLGSNNIGNQLLQKLGWVSGSSLGRKDEDASGGPDGPNQSKNDNLRKDWEKIEALAGNATRH
jgi:RNA-binding protein 5/10